MSNKEVITQKELRRMGSIIQDTAESAGRILKEFFEKRDKFEMTSKGGLDYVTEADKKLDNFIIESLQRQLPGIPLLTEETASEDYSSLKSAEQLLVIDPIDGTMNFKRGKHDFGIGIALVNRGQPIIGVAKVPMYDELYYADINTPTSLNGKIVTTGNVTDLSNALFCTDWAYKPDDRRQCHEWLKVILPEAQAIQSPGSAVANLAFIASGKVDVYLQAGLKPWDVAAAGIIIRQAGGIVTAPDGGEWDVFNPDILAACTPALHKQVLDLIKTI